jgi:hypothetical protein
MLVPIVEVAGEGAPTPRGEGALTPPSERRGVGAVLGVVLGLALIVACLVFLLRQPAGGIDGRARLRAAFDLGTLPYELEVVNSAQLFKGEESVVLANPRAEPEPPKNPVPEKSTSPEASENTPSAKDESKPPVPEEAKPRYDWSKLAMGEARPPRQLALMWYPPAVGDAQIKQQFGESGRMSVRDIGDEGGLTEVESGTLVWGPYAPAFAHERLFEAGRTFRDSLRVNLSTPGQYCVMVVTWPRNSPGSKAHVDEILKALAPKSIPEAAR